MYRLLTNLSCGLLILLFSGGLSAQTRDQPIQIEANKAEYSDRSGVSTYQGNVVLTQGVLVLRGQTLTVTRNKVSGNIEAVLVGSPATLEKPPEDEATETVNGRAKRMEYDSNAAVLTLNGDAYVKRGGDVISGETIKHHLNSARTEALSADSGERVKIIIQPDSADQAAAPAPRAEQAESPVSTEPAAEEIN